MALQFTVPTMARSARSDTSPAAIQSIEPTATATAEPQTKRANIEAAPENSVTQAILNAGYTVV